LGESILQLVLALGEGSGAEYTLLHVVMPAAVLVLVFRPGGTPVSVQ
jgi:hypothetical protein